MAAQPPVGEPAPRDGSLPPQVRDGAPDRQLCFYVHVPFCRVRCGYCDFNTYTTAERPGANPHDFAALADLELELARRVLGDAGVAERPVQTVFFGGGTPTLLPAEHLVAMLDSIRARFPLAPGAEITTEANPDSVDADYLQALARAGFTRVSFGMQSAVPHVLRTLDRTHDPARLPQVVAWARAAGLQVSVDLIYGSPGESLADWRHSLESAIALQPDHVSAYALIVEAGTKLAGQIRRGVYPEPDDDLHADMYELADDLLQAAGLHWYEISNWASDPAHRSRHNQAYWTGEDWWGVGPGAHSHVGGVRFWNVKHPVAYANRLHAGDSPAQAREVLDRQTRRTERVLLESRTVAGVSLDLLSAAGRAAVAGLIADGLLDGRAAISGRAVLTVRGRLLADLVVHRLLE